MRTCPVSALRGIRTFKYCNYNEELRMTTKRRVGRPLGGKYPEEFRKVWREYMREYRARKVSVEEVKIGE